MSQEIETGQEVLGQEVLGQEVLGQGSNSGSLPKAGYILVSVLAKVSDGSYDSWSGFVVVACLFVLSFFLPFMSPNEYLCPDSIWEHVTRTEVPEHLGGGWTRFTNFSLHDQPTFCPKSYGSL